MRAIVIKPDGTVPFDHDLPDEHRVAMLGEFPRIGPPSQRGTRKLVVTGTPYILIYRETLDRVAIVGLWHHALRKRSK